MKNFILITKDDQLISLMDKMDDREIFQQRWSKRHTHITQIQMTRENLFYRHSMFPLHRSLFPFR